MFVCCCCSRHYSSCCYTGTSSHSIGRWSHSPRLGESACQAENSCSLLCPRACKAKLCDGLFMLSGVHGRHVASWSGLYFVCLPAYRPLLSGYCFAAPQPTRTTPARYGDVTPSTTAEVLYTIIYVMINIVVWAYVLGTITLLVTKQVGVVCVSVVGHAVVLSLCIVCLFYLLAATTVTTWLRALNLHTLSHAFLGSCCFCGPHSQSHSHTYHQPTLSLFFCCILTLSLCYTQPQDEELGVYRQRMQALNAYCNTNNLPHVSQTPQTP